MPANLPYCAPSSPQNAIRIAWKATDGFHEARHSKRESGLFVNRSFFLTSFTRILGEKDSAIRAYRSDEVCGDPGCTVIRIGKTIRTKKKTNHTIRSYTNLSSN